MNILITRPEHQACGLKAQLETLGHRVFLLPCMEIRGLPWHPSVASALKEWPTFHRLIFTSANAIEPSQAVWFKKQPVPLTLAIGPGTQKALARYGMRGRLPEHFSTEGLLAMTELSASKIQGKHVAIFTGEHPKPQLAHALRAKGAKVHLVFCYQRRSPQWHAPSAWLKLKAAPIDWIVSTSPLLLSHLYRRLYPCGGDELLSIKLLVMSNTMQDLAKRLFFQQIACVGNASDQAIMTFFLQPSI